MADLKKVVGENIRRLRKMKKWTQAELAEKVGIEPVTIARIETGLNFPKEENITSIAKILNVEIPELFASWQDDLSKESALNYIHYNIHNLNDRDLKIIYTMIKTMSFC